MSHIYMQSCVVFGMVSPPKLLQQYQTMKDTSTTDLFLIQHTELAA